MIGFLNSYRVLYSESRSTVGYFDMGLSFDGYGETMDKSDIRPIISCVGVLEDNVSESNQDPAVSGRVCGYEPGGVSSPKDHCSQVVSYLI